MTTSANYKTFTPDQFHDLDETFKVLNALVKGDNGANFFDCGDVEDWTSFNSVINGEPGEDTAYGAVEDNLEILKDIVAGLKSGHYKLEIA